MHQWVRILFFVSTIAWPGVKTEANADVCPNAEPHPRAKRIVCGPRRRRCLAWTPKASLIIRGHCCFLALGGAKVANNSDVPRFEKATSTLLLEMIVRVLQAVNRRRFKAS